MIFKFCASCIQNNKLSFQLLSRLFSLTNHLLRASYLYANLLKLLGKNDVPVIIAQGN